MNCMRVPDFSERGRQSLSLSAAAIVLTVLIAAVALAGGCAIFGRGSEPKSSREIAALVNGEKIYVDEVNEAYASLTPGQAASITKADALSFLIEREILYQEAVKQGVQAADDEVKQEYEFYLLAGNLTETQLKFQLAGSNSSIEKFRSGLKKQILINKLLDKKVPSQFVVKHEEVEALYNASRFPKLNISFDKAQKTLVDLLNAQRQRAARDKYIDALKDKADVLIVAVPY